MDASIRASLIAKNFDKTLVDELLATYIEAKQNFFLGGHRLQGVEAGRFCEAVLRMLEAACFAGFTPIGRALPPIDKLIERFSNVEFGAAPESVRLHIPRALKVVYGFRNQRDAAHLADDIDPNVQDATLICAILDWVMAELVRLYHINSAIEARQIIEDLVRRKVPALQDFNGHLKALDPEITSSNHCLLMLYQRGSKGATYEELIAWSPPKMRKNLRRTLYSLEHEKKFLHSTNETYQLTYPGQSYVEQKRLLGS